MGIWGRITIAFIDYGAIAFKNRKEQEKGRGEQETP